MCTYAFAKGMIVLVRQARQRGRRRKKNGCGQNRQQAKDLELNQSKWLFHKFTLETFFGVLYRFLLCNSGV